MARLSAALLTLGVALSAREAAAVQIEFTSHFNLIQSSPSPYPRDWYVGAFEYDTDTNALTYRVTQELSYGAIGFSYSVTDVTGARILVVSGSGSDETDWGSYWTHFGTMILADESEAGLLAGHWRYSTSSMYTAWSAALIPVPEPAAAELIAIAAAALLAARRWSLLPLLTPNHTRAARIATD